MPLDHPSPICTVDDASTLNGVDVADATTVVIALADTAGVKQWAITCLNTDETLVAATITAGLVVDNVTKSALLSTPGLGTALIFKSVVNNGKDANGRVDPSLTTTFGIYVLTAAGYRVGAFDETTEGNAAFGWIAKLNPFIRGSVDIVGATLTLSGNADVGGALTVDGAATVTGPASFVDIFVSHSITVPQGGTFDFHQATKTSGSGIDGSITAQAGQQSSNTSGAFLNLGGGLGHGSGVDGGVRLKVGSSTVLEVLNLAGQATVRFGVAGGGAEILGRSDAGGMGFVYEPRATGNGDELNVVGQDTGNGNGGDVKVTAGTSAGGGVHGRIKFRIGGVTMLEATPAALLIVGDPTNGATASLEICGPLGTTVGVAGAAAAPPASPEEYTLVKNSAGQLRKMALYLP